MGQKTSDKITKLSLNGTGYVSFQNLMKLGATLPNQKIRGHTENKVIYIQYKNKQAWPLKSFLPSIYKIFISYI